MYPHDVVSELSINDTFVKGDIIAYNTGFFEKDFFDPKRVVLKMSLNAKTALYESNQTYEDGSSVSASLSDKLAANVTKVKSIIVGFNQNIHNVVSIGQIVNPKEALMVIEDEITSNVSSFDEESLMVLANLSKQAPKAKYKGTIDKVEVFYHGSKEDMSKSLLALVEKSDKVLSDLCKSSGKPVITGEVDGEYRVSGVPLDLDKAEIKIYITVRNKFSIGDKNMFANQLKSITGEVMEYDMHTEDGEKIEAIFSNRGIASRVTNSPYIIGTTTSLLKHIGKTAVKIYRG